ncbi:hypothetical protein Acr_24g0000080 [Actinidia rufa]|uniref:Uncharacterized protein n=1 Tax=Actinidia rufa TaxID=165716 RepID=A0A7J0GSR5_9ERIC|nr:hypothetical protein Acr_24g0000080 [Actinidia rufa]
MQLVKERLRRDLNNNEDVESIIASQMKEDIEDLPIVTGDTLWHEDSSSLKLHVDWELPPLVDEYIDNGFLIVSNNEAVLAMTPWKIKDDIKVLENFK